MSDDGFPDTCLDFPDVKAYLNAADGEHVVAAFPVFFSEDTEVVLDENERFTNSTQGQVRGLVFAIVPGAETHAEAMRTFLLKMAEVALSAGQPEEVSTP